MASAAALKKWARLANRQVGCRRSRSQASCTSAVGSNVCPGSSRANLAAASLPNFTLPTDNGPTARYWNEDIVEETFTLNREDSSLAVPNRPGLGVAPSLDRMEKYLVRKETFTA